MIDFSDHAIEKIIERKLKKSWIIKTVNQPEHVKPSWGNRTMAYRKFGKQYLKVVFVKQERTTTVITAFFEKGVIIPV